MKTFTMKTALLVVTITLLLAIVSARGIRDERGLRNSIEKALIMEAFNDEVALSQVRGLIRKALVRSKFKPQPFVSIPQHSRTFPIRIPTSHHTTNPGIHPLLKLVQRPFSTLNHLGEKRYEDDEIDDEIDDQNPNGNCL